MNTSDLMSIADISIEIELLVSEIYDLFSRYFAADSGFWAAIAGDERNHASIIQGGRSNYSPSDKLFPTALLNQTLRPLIDNRRSLMHLINKLELEPPSRGEAFAIALEIEDSAGEGSFQAAFEQVFPPESFSIYKEMVAECVDHAEKIRNYMKQCGIEPAPLLTPLRPQSPKEAF